MIKKIKKSVKNKDFSNYQEDKKKKKGKKKRTIKDDYDEFLTRAAKEMWG